MRKLSVEQTNVSESVYSMYCFWSGEATLGKLDGVLKDNQSILFLLNQFGATISISPPGSVSTLAPDCISSVNPFAV